MSATATPTTAQVGVVSVGADRRRRWLGRPTKVARLEALFGYHTLVNTEFSGPSGLGP
jgi:hypothetical protein